MALATGTLFEIRASATTGNTGASGFNTANANFPTDLTATSATGNAPVVSSSTYTFVAGDTNAWLYVKSGTNWTPGFYQITSVSAGAATVNATIGAATQLNTVTNMWAPNTVAGVATTASPTGGTFGVDYSQQDTAQATATDYASTGASTTLTSISAGFTRMMVGNFIHITTTGTGAHFVVGWYELVSFTNSTTMVTDRTTNDGTAGVAGTGFVGGAGRLNGLEDAFYEMIPASSMVFIKSGTYTASAAVSVASTNSTAILMSLSTGYTSIRGDVCNSTNRPTLVFGANNGLFGQGQSFSNVIFTTTAAAGITIGAGTYCLNCKFINTSTVASRVAATVPNNGTALYTSESISQNGTALSIGNSAPKIVGCYFHDSGIGISGGGSAASTAQCLFSIFEANTTAAITVTSATTPFIAMNCTIYGREAKIGTGLNFTGANASTLVSYNNIFYGLTTAISVNTGPALSNLSKYNDFFNNTADVSNWYKDSTDIAVDPQFAGASQITGTSATTSGSVLTDGSVFSGVTDNVDYLHVVSGSGVTTGIYLINSHTATTLTVNNPLGTGTGVTYFVTNGHNFAIGTNLKATGFPGVFPASLTTGYLDIGAAQRQEAGSGTPGATFC